MSRFYGSMQGSRGEATRCGTPSSGITAHVRGWEVGVMAEVKVCSKCGGDRVLVELTGGSNDSPTPPGIDFTYFPQCDA